MPVGGAQRITDALVNRLTARGGVASPGWLGAGYGAQSLGELQISALSFSMVSQLVPRRSRGIIMGAWFLGMGISLFGFGVLGIVILQATAATSIVGFFLRHRRHEPVLTAIVAPALGGVGLLVGLAYMVSNYSILATGSIHDLNYLPWLLPAAAVVGAVVAARRRAGTVARSERPVAPMARAEHGS